MSLVDAHGELMLIACIAALALGPALHWLATRASRIFSLIDGFVVVGVLGLALLEIVPAGIEGAGWMGVLAIVAGLLLPRLLEPRLGGRQTHTAAAWIALAGLAVHALTDGMAVGGSHMHGNSGHALEWAVILHRVPMGLAVWWMLTGPERGGQRAAGLALATIAVSTIVGFFLVGVVPVFEDELLFGLIQAFVGGLLLHVVSHGVGSPSAHRAEAHPLLPGLGGLAGLAMVLALFVLPHLSGDGHGHEHGHHQEIILAFWSLVLESAPALLLAYGLAGLISKTMGEAPARWLRQGSSPREALRGVIFGLPLPLCSCGVVPVYRSLIKRGVPATAALAFLIATPELGLDALLLSLPLLGSELTLLRVVMAFVLALAIGWGLGRWAKRLDQESAEQSTDQSTDQTDQCSDQCGSCHSHDHDHDHDHDQHGWAHKLRAGLQVGYGEVLDSTGPWIILGLLIAAMIQPWLDTDALTRFGPNIQVLVFALIGMPVYVCATGATPLVAVLVASGLSPGAALAFLLTGPATNATTFGVLEQLHGRKVAMAFVGTMLAAVLGMGWAINLTFPMLEVGTGALRGASEHGPFATICAVALGSLFLVSLVRQGPRRFLGRLWEQGGHSHGHDHDHGEHAPCCSSALPSDSADHADHDHDHHHH
ncbi:permease [Pseudenhygromyxa sp. WMMC2535]|uniref:permease n=1 Tax=Pseudenhygromyxa sp. WMMC2535 TaxID=2712867 RepID=UPI0015540B9F|nr:permease [Pseudenhygromyxa sp. WMMC2535]NVB40580.1 permease [Pseudenhygromyxa sp. WMMC2535]